MLGRTPPRRSPRFHQSESGTTSITEPTLTDWEPPATATCTSTHEPVPDRTVTIKSTTVQSTGAHAEQPDVEVALQTMRSQIAALEQKLKNAELRLHEGENERQRLLLLPQENPTVAALVPPLPTETQTTTSSSADSNGSCTVRDHVTMHLNNPTSAYMSSGNMSYNMPSNNMVFSNMSQSNAMLSNISLSSMPPSSAITSIEMPTAKNISSIMSPSVMTTSSMQLSNLPSNNLFPVAGMPTNNMLTGTNMPTYSHRTYFQPTSMQVNTTSVPVGNYNEMQSPYNCAYPAANLLREPSSTNGFRMQNPLQMQRKVLDLPDFNGQPADWPIFYTAFLESNALYNYSNFENNQRLNKCLKGEAKELVKSLLIHPDNVAAVIEQLQFRFGRPEQLIRSQLKIVRDVAPISEATLMKIISFATVTKNLVVFLKSVNGDQHLGNPTLLDELVGKLPMTKRMDWARCAASIKPYPTVQHFSDWLSEIANILCIVQDSEPREVKRRSVLHAAEKQHINTIYTVKCLLCQGNHRVSECQKFLKGSISERWSLVKRHRLCFSCLKMGHVTRDCYKNRTCSVNGCQRKHHQLLHESQTPKSSEETVLNCAADTANNRRLLFRVVPVTLFGPNRCVDTYALLDEGSSITMMDKSLMLQLGLKGKHQQLSMQWFGGRAAQEPTEVVNVQIKGIGKTKRHILRNVYSVADLKLPMQSVYESDLLDSCRQLELPTKPYSNITPQLLIGLDHCHLGLPTTTVRLHKEGPYAANTELGWVVFGPTSDTQSKVSTCLHVSLQNELELHNMISEYFETENFGVKSSPPIISAFDLRAQEILQMTTKRVANRFQTGLLWKCDDIQLPDSYSMAFKRLTSIERKMRKDSNFAAAYIEIIESYVEKKYARKLEPAEAAITSPKTWYLPHFAVVNPNKPAKLRMVFDAAAEVNGVSLNSQLLKGPQQYRPLAAILFHFREGAIAVCADIREMFHQVLIQPDDREAQRFLWRGTEFDKPPDVYEMLVMTFGAACSPCSANYIKTINAIEHQNQDSRAVKAILDFHYVDDFVDSFSTVTQAIEISTKVREIHAAAGFELVKFISSSKEVIDALGGSDSNLLIKSKDTLASEKVLGMFWQPTTDEFKYELKFNYVDKKVIDGERSPTKRELLSIVMSIFDPLGFLCHMTIAAKLLLREVWRRSIGWDEPLPNDVNEGWLRFRQQMLEVVHSRIPRYYFRGGAPQELQLHIFVDASEEAFAAIAYWRIVNETMEVETSFVCAKAKSAPLKTLTIPRLELQAAVLGTRLMMTIVAEHTIKIDRCVFWSDSKTVINWIKSEHRRYKPFVAHRIAEILAASKPNHWRWLPTGENVADEATRAKSRVDLGPSARWFLGPSFLLSSEDQWPTSPEEIVTHEEDEEIIRPKTVLFVVSKKFIDFTKFSSFSRLKRAARWVIRFVDRCKGRKRDNQQYGLTAAELHAAEHLLCRLVQREVFAEEMDLIERNKLPPPKSILFNLTPYIDEYGILRVSGRIDAASWLPYNSKRPIILPSSHYFTKLLVHHHHQRMHHQNAEATIFEIRRKFWIPRVRQVLRTVIASCLICKATKVMPVAPLMGSLPKDRLTPYVRPFTFTGVDYFGPLLVAVGRRTEKRWVALFTCLTVRAIHLEMVHDLTTDSCIIAIRNFINRRGAPLRMRSDNGKKLHRRGQRS